MNRRQRLLEKIVNGKNLSMKKIIIILLALLGIVAVIVWNAYTNEIEVEKQLQQNLTDVAKQNASILDVKISAQYNLLSSLAKELDGVTTDTIEEKLNHFRIFLEEGNVKRFAFCFPDGMTFSTDGEETDLSYREFYQSGMEKKCSITGILSDALREEHGNVNVMTIPVLDEEDNVTGVFGLAYDTDKFNESLEIESFDGKGFTCIINEKGEIMAATGNQDFVLSENLLTDILAADAQNEKTIEKLQQQMSQKESGSGTMYLNGKGYYYMVPVDLMDGSVTWNILTIVPYDILHERVLPIQKNHYIASALVIALVGLGGLLLITFVQEQHRKMLQYAYTDPLTKGANFIKFCMDMDNRENCNGYLVALDISNFNNIMIVAGKEASNALVRDTWDIICNALLEDETAGRVKDDMFILFLEPSSEQALLSRMEKISEQIVANTKNYHVFGVRAGYGIYRMTEPEAIEKAYSKVKLAKEYAATKQEVNYAFYNEINRLQTQHEKELEARFPEAIEKKEFEVWYQPKYSAADCTVVGSEALVRWRKENGEMVSPGEFIPLFERNGMIMKLDEYMFRSVCRQQKQWMSEGKKIYPVSINVSRASLYSSDIEQRYRDIMEESGISPEYIQLEVTETAMEERVDLRELLNKFRQMGIKILMDDFGTGYSSLATLSAQCFDTLKLDKTLIDHIGDKDGETLLYYVIRMGQQMGLHITAEGVEDKSQLQFLQELKCDDIQGFYFSRPLPLHEYEDILE